ncbi:MAG TPA: DUF397 domain-containing protein [Trebonia sp.]|nr:DUF397 domain-containing protein [Trebonia sp.]
MEQTFAGDWRKSSFSGSNGGSCVEVGTGNGAVLVRDTTNRKAGSLPVTAGAWTAFLATIKLVGAHTEASLVCDEDEGGFRMPLHGPVRALGASWGVGVSAALTSPTAHSGSFPSVLESAFEHTMVCSKAHSSRRGGGMSRRPGAGRAGVEGGGWG